MKYTVKNIYFVKENDKSFTNPKTRPLDIKALLRDIPERSKLPKTPNIPSSFNSPFRANIEVHKIYDPFVNDTKDLVVIVEDERGNETTHIFTEPKDEPGREVRKIVAIRIPKITNNQP